MIKILGYYSESFADAPGVSCVIFISGCRHNCKGCHSPGTHDFSNGIELTEEVIKEINDEIDKRPFLSELVLSGGDPMYSAKEILPILDKLHIPHNQIWCYSGFTFEQILQNKDMKRLLERCNVLVDGMFDITKRDITLQFRGSSNQRIIDVPESLKRGRVIPWNQ